MSADLYDEEESNKLLSVKFQQGKKRAVPGKVLEEDAGGIHLQG